MAFTSSMLVKTVYGNERVFHIRVTADAASGSVDTGLNVIDFAQCTNQSATTGDYRVFINTNSGLTALNGTVAISGVANGDVLMLTVYGH